VRLDGDEPEYLAEGDGHQRVVDAAAMRYEERDDGSASCRGKSGDDQANPQVR
jgi:hypothetical protein